MGSSTSMPKVGCWVVGLDLTKDSRAKLAKAERQDDGNLRLQTTSGMKFGVHDPSTSVEAGLPWRPWRYWREMVLRSLQFLSDQG
jgi:hypothetical protein